MGNRLQFEKSPYLLQHAENPVDWHPWGEEAFEKAAREDKPIFLSIGYSTCHWCHVMAHESFEDMEVADALNRDFVSIKVDREERPDVDAVYMNVCQALNGTGGWPLTVLMTPDQKPFFAGTYFPKSGTYGRPGLLELLERVAELWTESRTELIRTGNEITQFINQNRTSSSKEPDLNTVEQAAVQLKRMYDKKWGGFGRAPKFPTPHNLLFLMRYGFAVQEESFAQMALTTLEKMARGGMHDHIGGGFSRYSTDAMWLVPHFEKMLYDNALLLSAYAKAYQYTKKDLFADAAHRTARYILRELRTEEGSCCCGQDADSEGVEGKYYVFTPDEIVQVLGKQDGEAFCRLYDVTQQGNFEGKSIPNLLRTKEAGWTRQDPRLKKLYEYRKIRTHLHKDDKILLSWNAWAMMAFAQAGLILNEPEYLQAAMDIHQFIERRMTAEDDLLYLRWRDGQAAHAGQLDDYAVYALALLEMYRATLDVRYLQKALHRAEQMREHFEDRASGGGYFMTAADGERLIARPKEIHDGAIPSGNSVAAMVLQRLAALTGDQKWLEAAHRQLRYLANAAADYPSGSCYAMLTMMDALYPHRELVCASANGLPKVLWDFLRAHPAQELHILLKTAENAEQLARCAPFTADYPIPKDGEMYYLCENSACSTPVCDFARLNLG